MNLRHERRRRGKSLRAMADEIGGTVTKRVLLHAEHGGRPNHANQLAIAMAYGLDVIVQWPDEDAEHADAGHVDVQAGEAAA